MQWVVQATGQAGNSAAHLIPPGAVDHLAVNDRRSPKGKAQAAHFNIVTQPRTVGQRRLRELKVAWPIATAIKAPWSGSGFSGKNTA